MRVCFLTQAFVRYHGDPIGSFVCRLGEELGAHGVAVTAVAPHAKGLPVYEAIGRTEVMRFRYAPPAYERLAYQGMMHRLVQGSLLNKVLFGSFLVSFVVATVRAIRRQRSDLLHAHWWFPSGLVGSVAAAITRVPLVITCHGTDVRLLRVQPALGRLARWVFTRASAVTVVSDYLRQELISHLPELENRVVVIPMPIDRVFTQAGTRALPVNGRPRTIVGAGRLSRQKGFQDLIAALSILKQHNVAVNVSLIGEGDAEHDLRDLAHGLHVDDQVQFLPFQTAEELAVSYRSCDAVVLPSYDEGLGLALVEAMFCGTPVVGTDAGGIRDLIADGETGLLVPPGDVEGLAAALRRLFCDTGLAERLATAGQAYVRRNYDPETCVEKMLGIYRSVVETAG